MSGILRNTLHLVKYAPNNSTKYLRSMTFTTNHLNNSLSLLQPNYLNHNRFGNLQLTQAKKISTDYGTTIWATGKKILSLFATNEEIKKNANIVHLKVSLSSGKVRLLTPEEEKYLIFPPKFSIKVNEEPIDPSNNNIDAKPVTLSFYLGKWHVTLDDDELTLKIRDTGEIFILRHEVYVKALIKPPKQLEDGTYQMVPDPPISDYGVCGAKIISKQAGLEPFERSFAPRQTKATAEILKSYGNPISEALIDTKSARIIDDTPNSFGRMKLKFPMTVSLEGAPLQIKIKNSDDIYTAYHTVDIRASKTLAENLKNGSTDEKTERRSKIDKLRMQLVSGDLIFEPRVSSDQSVFLRQEVDIEIDLDSEVPSILVSPHLKTYNEL